MNKGNHTATIPMRDYEDLLRHVEELRALKDRIRGLAVSHTPTDVVVSLKELRSLLSDISPSLIGDNTNVIVG